MGFLSNLFGSSGVSAKEYGELLADLILKTLDKEFEGDRESKIRREFKKEDWIFDYDRYYSAVLNLYVGQAAYHVHSNHLDSLDSLDDVFSSMLDSVLYSVPDKYEINLTRDGMPVTLKLTNSDEPTLTASRMAAEDYFGPDPQLDQIMIFGASAKSFSNILNKFEREIDF